MGSVSSFELNIKEIVSVVLVPLPRLRKMVPVTWGNQIMAFDNTGVLTKSLPSTS